MQRKRENPREEKTRRENGRTHGRTHGSACRENGSACREKGRTRCAPSMVHAEIVIASDQKLPCSSMQFDLCMDMSVLHATLAVAWAGCLLVYTVGVHGVAWKALHLARSPLDDGQALHEDAQRCTKITGRQCTKTLHQDHGQTFARSPLDHGQTFGMSPPGAKSGVADKPTPSQRTAVRCEAGRAADWEPQ